MQYIYIAMIIVVAASNYLVQFPINDWLTLGAFPYPVSFAVTEIANRLYGPKSARKVVYIGFAWGVLLSIWLATPKIAFASGTAFLVSQLLDISIFNQLRQKVWWYAPLSASLLASVVDSAIFWNIAFWGRSSSLHMVDWRFFSKSFYRCCDVNSFSSIYSIAS